MIGFFGIIIFLFMEKIKKFPLVKKKPKINYLKLLIDSIANTAFAFIILLIMIKLTPNLVLLEIIGGGLIGAILSLIIAENRNIIKRKKSYTRDDLILSIIICLAMLSVFVIVASI